MARFYQTSSPEVIDYIPDFGGSGRASSGKAKTPFGELEVIAEDRPLLQDKMNAYYKEVQGITEQLRQNPKDLPRIQPLIYDLRRRINDDYRYGEIAAMRDRKKIYDDSITTMQTTFKNNPLEYTYAVNNMEIEPLNFDKTTGTFGKISAPKMAIPWSDEMWQDALKNADAAITPRLIEEAKTKNIPINGYTNAVQIMNALGYTEDQALQGILSVMSPEALDSFDQHYQLRGVELPDFIIDDKLNPEHPLAKKLAGWAKSKAGISDLRIDTRQGINYGKKAAVEKTDKGPGENATANYYAEGFQRVLDLAKNPPSLPPIPQAALKIDDEFLLNQSIKVADEDGKTAVINLKGTIVKDGKPYAVVDKDEVPANSIFKLEGVGNPRLDENEGLLQITPELLNSVLGDVDFRDFWNLVQGKYPTGKAKTTTSSTTAAPAKKSAKAMLK